MELISLDSISKYAVTVKKTRNIRIRQRTSNRTNFLSVQSIDLMISVVTRKMHTWLRALSTYLGSVVI